MLIDFDYFCKVKTSRLHIIILIWLSVFAASCGNRSGGDTFNVSPELASIDSLMWEQPDSALAVMLDYLGNDGRDAAHHVSTIV